MKSENRNMIDINKLKEHLERIESYNKELGVF